MKRGRRRWKRVRTSFWRRLSERTGRWRQETTNRRKETTNAGFLPRGRTASSAPGLFPAAIPRRVRRVSSPRPYRVERAGSLPRGRTASSAPGRSPEEHARAGCCGPRTQHQSSLARALSRAAHNTTELKPLEAPHSHTVPHLHSSQRPLALTDSATATYQHFLRPRAPLKEVKTPRKTGGHLRSG